MLIAEKKRVAKPPRLHLLLQEELESCLHRALQSRQSSFEVARDMHAQSAAPSFRQNLEIAASLRCLHDSECVLLAWHRELHRIVARDLQEDSSVGAAFIGLTGRMQKTRPKAEAGRNVLAIPHGVAYLLQRFFVLSIHLHIAENCEIICGFDSRQVSVEIAGKGFVTRQLCQ